MAMTSKIKSPEMVTNPATADYYKEHGNQFVAEGDQEIGYRYDHIIGRIMKKPDGTEFTNNVTLSQPASEVLTLLKRNNQWYFVLGKQSRSPYVVEVDGQKYSKVFYEQVGGLVESNQDLQSAAIAESSQELGANPIFLGELIVPKVFKHTSYTDEVSKIYWSISETLGNQDLDANENITVDVIPFEDARKAFEDYIDGISTDFFGFDIADITILAMSVFFWKIDAGKIDLNNPKGNLL